MKKPSVKRVIIASVIALLPGLLQPVTIALNMALCTAPILISLLFAWAGWIPASVMALTTVVSIGLTSPVSYGVNGVLAGAAAFAVLVLPAGAAVWMLEKRMPFFRRMAVQIAAQTAALLLFMMVIYLGFKLDLVDMITAWIAETIRFMPAELLTAMIQNFAMSGMLTQESIEAITTGFITWADVQQVFDQALDTMNYQMKMSMPTMVLTSGLLTGLLTTSLPSWICARRGDEPQVDHRPVYTWRLPAKVVAGILVCSLTGIALQLMEVSGSQGVTVVFSSLGSTLFMIQGIAALHRRFRENGLRPGPRRALVVLVALFASQLLSIIGTASALFGRKGLVTGWMRKRMEEKEQRKEDDDE